MISKEQFFSQILDKTLYHEGGYVNNPLDKGGETYRGISRKNFPYWAGWKLVDAAKPLQHNAHVLKAEPLVKEFYWSEVFYKKRFHELKSLKVAAALFDFAVHGGYSVKSLQTILNREFGSNLKTDGIIGTQTIETINRANETRLVGAIMDWRKGYLNLVVQNNPSQQVFKAGWDNRLDAMSKVLGVVRQNPVKTTLIVIPVLVLAGYLLFFHNKPKAVLI